MRVGINNSVKPWRVTFAAPGVPEQLVDLGLLRFPG